jgi:hypothetical protein
LLIEYGEEIIECITTPHWPSVGLTGGLLVTLGVFGEVWFSKLALRIAEEISERADSDVALANERAAKAQQMAAEANLATERERVERLRVEDTLKRRTVSRLLNDEEAEQLKSILAPHAGQEFKISALADHGFQGTEQYVFLNQLKTIMVAAGWVPQMDMIYRGVTDQGVIIGFPHENGLAGILLHNFLLERNINSRYIIENKGEPISVLVGLR